MFCPFHHDRTDRRTGSGSRSRWLAVWIAALGALLNTPFASTPLAAQVSPSPGAPPWEATREDRRLLTPEIRGPRELLELVGVDESHLRLLTDYQPLGGDDGETLVKVLFRLKRFTPADFHRWQQSVDLETLKENPNEYRAEVIRVTGQAVEVARRELHPEVARLYDFSEYYVVTIQPSDASYRLVVCTREVPLAWLNANRLNETAGVPALFLKVGETVEGTTELIFAADRVGWYPTRPDRLLDVTPAQVALASAGMDLGLLDLARAGNRRGLGSSDRECFYQMLAACRTLGRASLDDLPAADLPELLRQPLQHAGHLVRMRGQVRRVTRVIVDLEEDRARLGFPHYYQLDVFVSLQGMNVELRDKQGNPTGAVFANRYPVTVCVTDLPDELQRHLGERNSGRLDVPLAVSGYFLKLWSYRTPFVAQYGNEHRQVGPLVIGTRVQVDEPATSKNPIPGLISGGVFLAVLVGIWLAIWKYGRADRQFERETLARQFEPDQPLNQMDLPVSDGPDFSNLP